MYSIKENIENTTYIKKSKFICKIYKIDSINDIQVILDNINTLYNDSTHICYAYIIDNIEKCYDDGEPSGTAGVPILNVLKKNNLTNILAVVIRYFGGIKLGVGGLSRAYSNSLIGTLKLTSIIELTRGFLVSIEFIYDNIKKVDYILKDTSIINKSFNDLITYNFHITDEKLDIIDQLRNNTINLKIMKECLIEKKKKD